MRRCPNGVTKRPTGRSGQCGADGVQGSTETLPEAPESMGCPLRSYGGTTESGLLSRCTTKIQSAVNVLPAWHDTPIHDVTRLLLQIEHGLENQFDLINSHPEMHARPPKMAPVSSQGQQVFASHATPGPSSAKRAHLPESATDITDGPTRSCKWCHKDDHTSFRRPTSRSVKTVTNSVTRRRHVIRLSSRDD